jgi:RHS repeat-associated protein
VLNLNSLGVIENSYIKKELDEETGLYYFIHRYFDPKLSGWISADPAISQGRYLPMPPINDKAKSRNSNLPGMGGVFNSINLDGYHYAGQNPVKLGDPDGNDIVLLQAFTGANNAGHSAMLVQVHDGSNKGKWMYISRNGTTLEGKKPEGLGAAKVHGVNHIQYFDSPEAFFKNQQDQVVAKKNGKSSKEVGEFTSKTGEIRYEEGLRIATSEKDDKIIRDNAIKLEKETYDLIRNNCNDLVDDSIDDVMFTSDIAVPNNWYQNMKDIYNGKDGVSKYREGTRIYDGNNNYDDKR